MRPAYRTYVLLACFSALLTSPTWGTTLESGPSSPVEAENTSRKAELFRLRIVNAEGGDILVSRDRGGEWHFLGRVLSPCRELNRRGFAASRWGKPGCVVATAVNAIHAKVAQDGDRPVIFSILPRELLNVGPESGFYAKHPSSIVADVPGGELLFGGQWSPFVGNPIFLERAGSMGPLPLDWEPQEGDALEIRVEVPSPLPREIVFENRFGGLITITYPGEEPKIIGQVLRPVLGVGRFTGGLFASISRIRANHCGVIDVSTSRTGRVGGFQIVPAIHAMNPDMNYIRIYTQWMVVGPLNATDPSFEGVAPLFTNYIRPDFSPAATDTTGSRKQFLGHFLVQMKFNAGPWRRTPALSLAPDLPLPGWASTALKEMTHLRILFPLLRGEAPPQR